MFGARAESWGRDMLGIRKGSLKQVSTRYGFAVGMVAAGFVLRRVLTAYVGPGWPTYITFYPAIMLVGTVAGFWPGVVATAVAALVVDYWILPPIGSFGIESFTDAAGLALFSGMGVFMSLVAEFYRRARQQAQERSLELTKANEALRELSSKLLSAHEEERKRVAGEIHDTLGSCLAAIGFKVNQAKVQDEKAVNGSTECLNIISPLIQECIRECKRIQMDLRPSMIDDLGLLPTLSWFCKRFETIYSHIQAKLTMLIEEAEIPSVLKIIIYRITQEAMNNIAKHSEANVACLSLEKMDRKVKLIIQDDGRGFDVEKAISQEKSKRGLGLSSMKERAELSGGFFAIESAAEKGTTISVSWPVESQSN